MNVEEIRNNITRNMYDKQEGLFRHHLEECFNTGDYVKRTALYDLAWEHGHSSGFDEVMSFYDDLVDVITL